MKTLKVLSPDFVVYIQKSRMELREEEDIQQGKCAVYWAVLKGGAGATPVRTETASFRRLWMQHSGEGLFWYASHEALLLWYSYAGLFCLRMSFGVLYTWQNIAAFNTMSKYLLKINYILKLNTWQRMHQIWSPSLREVCCSYRLNEQLYVLY